MSTCATASRTLSEPLAGTAALARTWLLIEQPGPWGAKALTSSHLDPAVGRALERAADGSGVRAALIRRPGRHADPPAEPHADSPADLPADPDAEPRTPALRRVYLAHTLPGRSWIRTAELATPESLLALDFAALGAGEHGGLWEPYEGAPLAFVCTNAKRDRCCALLGRPLAAELARLDGSAVWETTHIGGHRFAPTLLVLPYGYAYGRAEAHAVKDVLAAAREGRVVAEGSRGRSCWPRPAQAADLAVRELTGEEGADALDVTAMETHGALWTVTLAHADGRTWQVDVAQTASEPPRPESCGAEPGTPARMGVLAIRPAGASRARQGESRAR
ncbi:sucrase ferredoxin [Streptomyces pathocidini]|uniref:Sucrase ferredoxin n=2 Tax=Streptomyces pathocidini TaxID=1650571 RepID=A0ABW7UJG1_9ACTN